MLDGDEVAAYLLSYLYAADVEATGIREAWVGQLGTRARWRRRGLGTLLLAAALAELAAGESAETGRQEESPVLVWSK